MSEWKTVLKRCLEPCITWKEAVLLASQSQHRGRCARLQSMACAHRRCSPPKTVAHQLYLGVANQMEVTGSGAAKLFDKTSLLEICNKQTLILRSWMIGLGQGQSCSYAFIIIKIAQILTALGNNLSVHTRNCWCTPAHQKFSPCTPEISSKSAILGACHYSKEGTVQIQKSTALLIWSHPCSHTLCL